MKMVTDTNDKVCNNQGYPHSVETVGENISELNISRTFAFEKKANP